MCYWDDLCCAMSGTEMPYLGPGSINLDMAFLSAKGAVKLCFLAGNQVASPIRCGFCAWS
eukprot:3940822-Rhodomonas_salina.2